MPETLYLLLADVEIAGRVGGGRVVRSEAEFEFMSIGGVAAPFPEFEFRVEDEGVGIPKPLVSFEELSEDLKLALERRRSSFRKAGAMVHLHTPLELLVELLRDS